MKFVTKKFKSEMVFNVMKFIDNYMLLRIIWIIKKTGDRMDDRWGVIGDRWKVIGDRSRA